MARRVRLESLAASWPAGRLLGLRGSSLAHAVTAGRRCLERSHYQRQDIDVIAYTGVYRDGDVVEPAFATYVQKELDINPEFRGRRTLSFDLINGGCGMLSAAHVLAGLLDAGQAQACLLVAAERSCDEWLVLNRVPASGAAAILDLSPSDRVGFGAFAFRTHEEHAELASGAVRLDRPGGRLVLERKAGLEKAWLDAASEVTEQLLAEEGLVRHQIDLVIPAQISPSLVAGLGRATGFPARHVLAVPGLRDTLSTSVGLALDYALRKQRVGRGQRVMLLAFASGITVGGAIYYL